MSKVIQNPNAAHLRDIVSPREGEFKDQHGTVVMLRFDENCLMARFAPEDDPTDYTDHEFAGCEVDLIKCVHQEVITGEQ